MRSYRGPNGEDKEASYGPAAYFLGPTQISWLKRELKVSRATWKVIAADMPISIYVVYDGDRKFGSEAVSHSTTARRWAVNWRSPTCWASSGARKSVTRGG